MRKATAAAMPNTIASTTVSGSSIMRELPDNRFIAYTGLVLETIIDAVGRLVFLPVGYLPL